MNARTIISTTAALLLTATLSAQEATLYTGIDLHSMTRGSLVADVYGIPNDLAVVVAGTEIPGGMASPFGQLFISPGSMFVLGNFVLDGSGAGQLNIPFDLRHIVGSQLSLQAITIAGGPKFAASKSETVYVDMDPGLQWVSTCTKNQKGCVKMKLTGLSGTKIEVIHNDGTRAGNTQMWSGVIPTPSKTLKSGLVCPPSWLPGEKIIIKVDGKVIRQIYH